MRFEEFVDANMEALSRYARVLSGDRQAAHDLLADTLVAASSRWAKIGRMDSPAVYVRRMITNRHIDQSRRAKTRKRALALLEAVPPPVFDATHTIDQRHYLDGLLRDLPVRQRAALVLRFYLALTDEEIAAELRIHVGSVRSSISRGLSTLRSKTTDQELRTHLP